MVTDIDTGPFTAAGRKHGYIIGRSAGDRLPPEEQGAAVRALESAVSAGDDVWSNLPGEISETPLPPTVHDLSPIPISAEEFTRRLNRIYGEAFLEGFTEAIGF